MRSIAAKLVVVFVSLALVAGAGVAGAALGPAVIQAERGNMAPNGSVPTNSDDSDVGSTPLPPDTQSLDSIVVDVRAETGELHHLKTTLAAELGTTMDPEEFKKLVPRGRNAAIEYLRSLDFEDVTSSDRFSTLRAELNARVRKAMGKKAVRRILFTDFVVQ